MKVLEVYDDLAWKRSNARIEAAVTATISLSVRDAKTGRVVKAGESFALDLGDGNYEDLLKYLDELADAGTILTRSMPQQMANGTSNKGGNISRGRVENAKLHKWVRDNHVMHRDDPSRLAHITPAGKAYRPAWLWAMFDAANAEAKDDGVGSVGDLVGPAPAGDRGKQG